MFLVAAGLTLVSGVPRILNFAHGSLFMVGAYAAYTVVGDDPSSVGAIRLGAVSLAASAAQDTPGL